MGRISRFCCVFLAALAGPALGVERSAPARLVALVAGRPVTLQGLADRLRLCGIEPSKAVRRDWHGSLQAAIDRELLLEAARREKAEVEEAEVTFAIAAQRKGEEALRYAAEVRLLGLSPKQERARMRERLMIERVLARKLGAKLFVPAAAVQDWYRKNKDLLARPETRVVRVITVRAKGSDGAAMSAARRKMAELRLRVIGGADFARIAREHSAGPWAKRGGLVGPVVRGESGSVFADRVFQIKKRGDVTEVFETKGELHILKLEEIRSAAVPAFKEAQERIRERLAHKLRMKHLPELTAALRRETAVRVFWRNIPWPAD